MSFDDFTSYLSDRVLSISPVLDLSSWSSRPPQFPAHHFKGGAMALPFTPSAFVYSPPVEIKIKSSAEEEYFAYYQRGIRKYQNMIQRGHHLPPVVFLLHKQGGVSMQDGSHRMAAAQAEGLSSIPAVLAVPKSIFASWVSPGIVPTKPKL